MAIVKQLDKRSGITYVYESTSYWDKEKQQPRSKRKLIGRLDPVTGAIVPTDGRGKRRSQPKNDNPAKRGPVPVMQTERLLSSNSPLRNPGYTLHTQRFEFYRT